LYSQTRLPSDMLAETENQQPAVRASKRVYQTRGRSKGLSTQTNSRRALGDISNRGARNIAGKKKAAVTNKRKTRSTAQTNKPQATKVAQRKNRVIRGNPIKKKRTTKPKAAVVVKTTRVTRSSSRRAAKEAATVLVKRKPATQGTQPGRKRSKNAPERDENTDPNPVVQSKPQLEVKSAPIKDDIQIEDLEEEKVEVPEDVKQMTEQMSELVSMIDTMDIEEGDSLAVYAEDIYRQNRDLELITQTDDSYMARQCEITPRMRQKLIDWLIDLHKRFRLEQETLYLGINLLDRYLSKKTVYKTSFQLVGCTALLLSSKYEEIYPPVAQDFVYMSANAFTREQLLQMETQMLNALAFNLTVPSILCFSQRFLKVVGVAPEEKKLRHHVQFFMEFTQEHYDFVKFNYSLIAACSCYMALRLNTRSEVDTIAVNRLMQYSGYSMDKLKPCLKAFKTLLNTAPRYMAVRRKFKDDAFHGVSEIDANPAFLGLDLE